VSYVLSIRRAESASAFSPSELERVAALHEGLALKGDVLVWNSSRSRLNLTLNITPRELWTDGTSAASAQEVTNFLAGLAASLDAKLVGEEGELLIAEPNESSQSATLKTVLGGVVALLSLPFVVLLALVRLPWVLWKLWGRAK
jgi:hypothetical protein